LISFQESPIIPAGEERMEKLMTVDQVAEYLRLSRQVVLRKARKGEIPAVKVGSRSYRFYKEQIDEWLRSRSTVRKEIEPRRKPGKLEIKAYPLGVKGNLSRKEIYEE